MVVGGAACGEGPNLVDNHDGSCSVGEEEFIEVLEVCVEKRFSRKLKWKMCSKLRKDKICSRWY